MKVTKICATRSDIVITLETEAKCVRIIEKAATVGPLPARILEEMPAEVKDGACAVSRFDGKHDRAYSAFEVYAGGEKLAGVQFVTDFAEDVPENRGAYPQPARIKAMSATDEDMKKLGAMQTLTNINLQAIMTTQPEIDDIAFENDGHTYYFVRAAVEKIDERMIASTSAGFITTMILLNSPRTFGSRNDRRLLDIAIHPDYDWGFKDAFISAFNMETEDGQRYYRAFVEFLVERYTRPDKRYGFAPGIIVSNEVDSQYVWGNAGEKTLEAYFAEYTRALRQTWLCARKHCAAFRVYVSLDHYWDGLCHNKTQPLRYYEGRKVVEEINRVAKAGGDFDWNIAFHPYPEDLNWCNFWMDRSPNFTFSTPRITFKNMEVLEAYMDQPHMRYRGAPRRLIFSEQGFNSRGDELRELTEEWAAAGYCLAYLKARKMKTLDLFTHHAYVDNPHEFGLNLGIRRFDPNAENHLGEPKPIYYAVCDMDTEREKARIEQSKKVIGESLFDYLLNPPVVKGDRVVSADEEFY